MKDKNVIEIYASTENNEDPVCSIEVDEDGNTTIKARKLSTGGAK